MMQKFGILFSCVFLFLNVGMAQLKMKKIVDLPHKIYETSGLLLYKKKYLITHNDGGNKSEIYILDLDGKLIKTIDIESTKNYDWEDLAQDEKGNIYIGDFGNNNNNRKNLHIYKIKHGFINKKKVEPKKISFWYDNQTKFPPKKSELNFDCEAFFYKDSSLFLLTKCRTKPFTGVSRIYQLPTKKGKHKAKLIGQFQFCSTSWQFCSVTSADYDPKSNTLTVLTYGKLYVVTNFKGNEFWKGNIKVYNIPYIKQREAIAYISKNKWYLTDEYKKGLGGGNLYKLYVK